MSQKRQQDDHKALPEASTSDAGRRKRPSFRNVVLEVMNLSTFHKYVEPVLEPLIRRVVKEELELALEKHTMNWDNEKEMHYSESRTFQLQFSNSLSLPVFTGTRIEGEDCNTLKVVLIDAHTGKTVTTGLQSSGKVEIVVLEGDFDGDAGRDWTVEEFNNNIVREREGKKPLLNGDVFLDLREGIGLVGDISFTDNSSWTRSRKFRLGARIRDNNNGIRVREAMSESFVVRDHRGELYKKHHPPYLSDEVWRLEKIGKEGAFHKRLSKEKIKTVKDFLVLLFLDPTRLRNILGTGMSTKMWEVTSEHARRCVLDDKKLYTFCPGSQQRKNGVVFNVVGQVLGLLSDGKYVIADNLFETEKADAQSKVISAFQHLEDVVPYDDEASLINGSCSLSESLYGTKSSTSQKNDRFEYPELNTSSPDIVPSVYPTGSMDDYGLHSMESLDVRFDHPLNFQGQESSSLLCETSSLTQPVISGDCGDVHLAYYDTTDSPADLQHNVNRFLFRPSAVDKAQAQRRWKVVSSVLKWLSLMLEIRNHRVLRIQY